MYLFKTFVQQNRYLLLIIGDISCHLFFLTSNLSQLFKASLLSTPPIIYTLLFIAIELCDLLLLLKLVFLVLVKLFSSSNIYSYVSFELSQFNQPPVIKYLLFSSDADEKYNGINSC